MAGRNPDFNARQFRDAIRFVYEMAAPPVEEQQATFIFASELIYVGASDDQDVPFDPDATVQRVTPDPVRVPCAVEYFDNQGQPARSFGILQPTRVAVTLLDEDYIQVKDAIRVVIDGDTYEYRRTEPPSGLFDVGLYVMHFSAESET